MFTLPWKTKPQKIHLVWAILGTQEQIVRRRKVGTGEKKQNSGRRKDKALDFSSPALFILFSPVSTFPLPAIFPWVSDDGLDLAWKWNKESGLENRSPAYKCIFHLSNFRICFLETLDTIPCVGKLIHHIFQGNYQLIVLHKNQTREDGFPL